MPDVPRQQLVAWAIAALVVVALGARYLGCSDEGAPRGETVPVSISGGEAAGSAGAAGQDAAGADATPGGAGRSGGWAIVQVAGEVHRPGVYRLRVGQRADDAVRLAGGPTARADLSGVNLAAKVEDGRQVIVPRRASAGASAGGTSSGAEPPGSTPPTASAGATGAPLNLNTATVEQLDQLDGIGPATAQKIVAYRQAHGGFRSVSELDHVPGIGPGRLAAIRGRVTV